MLVEKIRVSAGELSRGFVCSTFMIDGKTTAGKKKILAVSGSTRKNSTSESILNAIAALCSEALEIDIYLVIASLPHFNPDLDNDDVPSTVKHFRESIEHSDGVILCTPEYVHALPGAFKNAIDWTVSTTLFSNKPTAMIVASTGGEKAFESLQLILQTLGANVADQSKLLLQGARSRVDDHGRFADPTALDKIRNVVDSLLTTINSNHPQEAV